jgi:hypothetical protein
MGVIIEQYFTSRMGFFFVVEHIGDTIGTTLHSGYDRTMREQFCSKVNLQF